jgi:hypothetical protein
MLGKGKSERKREIKGIKRKGKIIEIVEIIEIIKITRLLKQCSISIRAELLLLKCAHAITFKTTKECISICLSMSV